MKGKIWRKILSVCLVLLMVAALVPTQLFSVSAASNIAYIYRWWDSASQQVKSETKYAEATKLQDYSSDLQDLYSGWYYSQNYIEFNKRVNIHGTVNIIICEEGGSYVKFKDGIHVSPGDTLNIYGQGAETQALEAFAETNDYAGIGGNGNEECGTINIYGGKVTAKADVDAAGIGGGIKGYGGHINIYGGKIDATGGSVNTNGGAGIGGGGQGWGGYINIYGGDVTAHGGANAAGIGGGDEGSSGDIVIRGGTIHTYGGSANSDGGAGIGGGNEKGVNNIVIYDGDITAKGGCDAAGIGGGDCGDGGNITIVHGTVNATGGKYGAGIGGGQGKGGGTIKIHGDIVTATAGDYGAGSGGGEDGSGGDITIDGGIVRATGGDNGAGIGGGDYGSAGTIRINADITAIGGKYGAGIGGGYSGRGGTITISGGSIESDGGECGAAIGGGNAGVCESITITNGSFNLKGGTSGAGIGGGNGKNGININISGGTFHQVLGGVQAAGIGGGDGGDGGKITITGGTFLSVKGGEQGAGIGGGIGSKGGEITISNARIIVDGGKYAAGIGGGYYGQSGTIVINSGTIDATGGANGGAGIGAGIYHPDAIVWDTTITINGGSINAYGSDGYEDDELPGAAIGCGGPDANSSHTADYGWYTGTIDLNGGIVKAFASSRVGNYEEDDNALTAIGLWRVGGTVCGTVHFGGADVTMSSTMDNSGQYSQVVKAGTITFDDDRLVKYRSYGTDELIKAKHDDRSNVLQGRQYSSVYVETCTHEDCQYTDKGDNHSFACPYCAKNAAENHKYSESDLNWNWAEDHLSATATFNCEKCGHKETVDATITKTVDDAGMATYTAAAQFGGKSYTDSVTDYADELGARVIGHSISLDGDIGVNFYMELSDAVADSDTAYMHFTIPKNGEPDTQDIKVSDVKSGDKTYYVFKCKVAAKEMTSNIKAQIIDGENHGTEFTYSVKEYADYLLTHTDEREDLAKAAPLVKALLNYGANTQIYFDKNPGKLANAGLTEAEKALGTISFDIAEPVIGNLPEGTTFEGATLSLKSETTLSLYFKSNATPVFTCDGYDVETVPNGDYLVARIRGIKAAHIGDRLPLKVNGNKAVTYSPLNYCKKALNDNAISDNLKNAIKAFYLYYNAADEYFNVIDLGTVTGDIVVQNSGVITGTLSGNHKISIADGATVRLRDANITSLANNEYVANYAGITLLGDATIILEGSNTVRGGHQSCPGIYVPEGKTLTIDGNGLLDASSNGSGCGIGGGAGIRCGNITIDGGNITATGGVRAAGIGGGNGTSCGDITINGGTVTATGGSGAAGIGSGYYKNASCGNITINGGTVTATGGESATGIGTGAYQASCGNITIANTVTQVTAIKGGGILSDKTIGASWGGTCGTVTIGGVEGAVSESPYTYQPE